MLSIHHPVYISILISVVRKKGHVLKEKNYNYRKKGNNNHKKRNSLKTTERGRVKGQ